MHFLMVMCDVTLFLHDHLTISINYKPLANSSDFIGSVFNTNCKSNKFKPVFIIRKSTLSKKVTVNTHQISPS